MAISIHSTDKRARAALELKEPGRVSMYVCGPTAYDSCHIGHARPAVVFDTVRRYLEYSGLIVTFVSNITDIDDKIINRANELGISYQALARRYQDEYEQDMARLGVLSPSIRPRATEHIPEMIALVQGLLEKGVAYRTPRGIWFDVSKFKDYGKLSGRIMDDENTEHRVEQDPEKRNPQDFALWKSAKPGEPSWRSPWGEGRPGWHLECSAMAGKYCDFEIDIHGGGADLSFPHHENELAQSEAFTGRRFVRQWMHNGFITVGKSDDGDDVKMGKSKGNAFRLRDAFKLASPAALRLWILGTHYRMPLLYKPEILGQIGNALDRIYNALDEISIRLERMENVRPSAGGIAQNASEAEARFREAMDDDFNTPQALAQVFELVNIQNRGVKENAPACELLSVRNTLNQLLWVLGLPLERPDAAGGGADGFIDLLVEVRNQLRAEKNFRLSDLIRDSLKELGVELRDRMR
ncbi:MAG: cysteine--tRNA ligase [Planctomycetota bacterium]|jgi:cysteinyl-tRNA synthetase|nr:cysteine--tRNA ligase [Planctomycetota bacterium]